MNDAPRPPDRFRFTTLAHGGMRILGPVPESLLRSWVERVAAEHPARVARVLDVGCGKGEWAMRLLERLGGTGLGLEPNPSFAHDALTRARSVLGSEQLAIETRTWAEEPLTGGAFTVAVCTGSLHAFGRIEDALPALRAVLAPDGLVLLGTPYWRIRPEPLFLAALGASEDDHASLDDTCAAVRTQDWEVLAVEAASVEACDAYEHAYASTMLAWCAANTDDPERVVFERRITSWMEIVQRWGRDTFGYALLLARPRAGGAH